ncbi:MAG: DUF4232 domain-containing protein [Streptomyces sp.]|uniref:DUF4232 domain-containing protein n=1 Tax=Streptomyces sp. TaxID=1931 RepID=UPI0025E408DC|nr:DUF4232 domain-containing protein [Streptomyces sp.]MBW8798874.1 DUF4232 domain-containing protein [Streptomyces sp.]
MRRPRPRLLAPAAVLLLATACGTEHTATGGGAGAAVPAPRATVTDPPVDGVRITSVTIPAASPTPSAAPGTVHADRLPGDSGISAAYQVSNDGDQAMTYTVLFDFTTDTGAVMAHKEVTVPGVGPGRSTRGTVEPGVLAPGASPVTRVKVAEVTKVPADEAPAETGACPASGVRLWADDGDAAMGLRVVGLHLENCGKRDYELDGYPRLSLLDENRRPVDGIRVLHGGAAIATGTGFDDPPGPLALKPGEAALSGLIWRNTTLAGTAVNVPYVRVLAKPGAAPVTVTPGLDLGTTGKLGVGAWKRADG